jgi:hypothetical protein
VLIDGADGSHKTGINESFDARAKFHGGLLGSAGLEFERVSLRSKASLPGRYFPFTTNSFEPAFFELLLNLLCGVHAAVGSDQHVVEPFGG